ncbi:unnamed protein product [Trichobilharzia regenti]|nr:unnamed protein product [Trichobilharzia regenti]
MSCPICESRHLVEDENTGQLICGECGTATGVFRGVTQFIMKCQANSLAKELNLSDEEKTTLCNAVWNIWLHYLAITGELGSDAWLDAAVALTKSISEVYQSKIGSLKEGDRPRHRNLRRCKENVRYCNSTPLLYENEWEFIKTRLSQLQWFGWGMLYEPDEGREIVSMLHVSQRK